MTAPLVKTCCFSLSLRTGSIISGVLGILLSIINILIILLTPLQLYTIILDWLPKNVVKIIVIFNLCMTIFISILLIVGVLKRNHYLMLPWVLLGIMLAVALLVSVIYTAVVSFIEGLAVMGACWLGFGFLAVLIFVYMWAVVYSYFANLRDENDRGRYDKQPYRR